DYHCQSYDSILSAVSF
nr:immunoglobulin light chain junction region [Macaca mulatta]